MNPGEKPFLKFNFFGCILNSQFEFKVYCFIISDEIHLLKSLFIINYLVISSASSSLIVEKFPNVTNGKST